MQPDHHHDEDAGDADERAWRAIVENYGDRPHLEDPPVRPPDPSPPPPPAPPAPGAPFGGRFGDPLAFVVPDEPVRPVGPAGSGADPGSPGDPGHRGGADEDEDRFVPPDPPAVPRASPDRVLAWAGVLGSPLVLLASLLLSFAIPEWAAYLLVVGFVGGFVYLVARMPREPREPWDDGAQV